MSETIPSQSATRSLATLYAIDWPEPVQEVLLAPKGMGTAHSLEMALKRVGSLPPELLPLAVVDEASIAVVALESISALPQGGVFRLFLTEIGPRHQLALLDVDPLIYVASLDEELGSRERGLSRVLDEIGPAYQETYISKGKRPRDFVIRPVRIACQNVIVALAGIAQDSSFDGLSVVAWQTCEVPHVATHEANRALAALTLCDAFQNGGTMEIRFDRKAKLVVNGKLKTYNGHPEGQVPASLRRYGRTIGVALGAADPAAISPAEARELFLAITPMPPGLRSRVDAAISSNGILPERICFTLLSQVWREIELDFILAASPRAGSILAGGADWQLRGARQAEAEVCRSAAMLGMLYRRLNSQDAAADGAEVRVIEDRARGITWEIDDTTGCVTFRGLSEDEPVPWAHGLRASSLRVVPCSRVTKEIVSALRMTEESPAAVVVPRDVHPHQLPEGIAVLRCPDRLADLDKQVEANLVKSRVSRG